MNSIYSGQQLFSDKNTVSSLDLTIWLIYPLTATPMENFQFLTLCHIDAVFFPLLSHRQAIVMCDWALHPILPPPTPQSVLKFSPMEAA